MTEKERWRELCELASKEQDPKKLHELVKEIDRLLQEKQEKEKQEKDPAKPRNPEIPTKAK